MKSTSRWSGGLLALTVGGWALVQGVVAGGGTGWNYTFNGSVLGGTTPRCTPTLVGSNLIVTTLSGGTYNQGVLLLKEAFNPSGVGLCVPVWEFGAATNDGGGPIGQALMVGSTLYGITTHGGTANMGTIYSVNTNTWVETPVHHFTGGTTNGDGPQGSLTASGSRLYGVTGAGGGSNAGTVFSYETGLLRVGQTRFNLLHSFAGGLNDGNEPRARLLLSGTTLYGSTCVGGANDFGVLFSLNTDGSNYSVLYHFTGSTSDGGIPQAGLAQSGSYLYGTTTTGGVWGRGTLFSYYTGPALLGVNRFHVLHNFSIQPTDGYNPLSDLVLAGTNLYGMTEWGGVSNKGTLYRISTGGSGYTNLLEFTGTGTAQPSGMHPAMFNGLTVSGKYIFGSTSSDGNGFHGTVFRLDLTLDPKLWLQTDAGQTAVWMLNTNGNIARSALMENTGGWALKAAGDIDGDGVTDLLFQDGSHNMAGWLMHADNTKRSGSFWSNTGAWDLKACADFEGTGRAQVLFQKPDGSLALWRLNPDGSYNSSAGLGNSTAAWPLRGAADLDGDGKADLIFQNAAGDLAVWKHLPNGTITGGVLPGAGTWILRGTVDVDGNGAGDLVWQAANGSVVGWFMNTNLTPMTTFPLLSSGVYKLKAGGR